MEKILDPTQREYNIVCSVFIKTIQTTDLGRTFPRTVAYLVPDVNHTEVIRFLNAWLPENAEERFEIGTNLATPVNSPCRVAIMRGNEKCPHHHLFVMTKAVEEDLIRYQMHGKKIKVHVLPEGVQDDIDENRDSELDVDLVE